MAKPSPKLWSPIPNAIMYGRKSFAGSGAMASLLPLFNQDQPDIPDEQASPERPPRTMGLWPQFVQQPHA